MAVVAVQCPECGSCEIVKYGRQANDEQQYQCNNLSCKLKIFPRTGSQPDDGDHYPQKKAQALPQVNPALLTVSERTIPAVVIRQVAAAERDEMWSCVGRKQQPRWLWRALDHQTGRMMA